MTYQFILILRIRVTAMFSINHGDALTKNAICRRALVSECHKGKVASE